MHMNTTITVRDLGHHGPKSKAPANIGQFLRELFKAILGRDVTFDVLVENRRLEPKGDEIVKALRIERAALVLRCWPTGHAADGRICHVRFADTRLTDHFLTELTELVETYNLSRNNYHVLLKEGRLHTPLDEFWTTDRLDDLTGRLLAHLNGRVYSANGAFDVALAKIIGIEATNVRQLQKHVVYLKNRGWLALYALGNNRTRSSVRPGRQMVRHIAVVTGAIDPNDHSDETLNRYVENHQILNGELNNSIHRLKTAENNAPKLEKKVERLMLELAAAQEELDQNSQTIARAKADIRAVYDLKSEIHPMIKSMMDECGVALPSV
jgi:hypothetical protein